jgi:hypothetical protein
MASNPSGSHGAAQTAGGKPERFSDHEAGPHEGHARGDAPKRDSLIARANAYIKSPRRQMRDNRGFPQLPSVGEVEEVERYYTPMPWRGTDVRR